MRAQDSKVAQIKRFGHAYLKVIVYLQIGIGLLLLVLAYHTGYERLALLLNGQSAQGQIVRYIEVQAVRLSDVAWFKPVVTFRASDQQIEFEDWNSRDYAAGVPEQVEVLYNPRQAKQAMIRRGNLLDWMPWAPFGLLGGFLCAVGLLGYLRRR